MDIHNTYKKSTVVLSASEGRRRLSSPESSVEKHHKLVVQPLGQEIQMWFERSSFPLNLLNHPSQTLISSQLRRLSPRKDVIHHPEVKNLSFQRDHSNKAMKRIELKQESMKQVELVRADEGKLSVV